MGIDNEIVRFLAEARDDGASFARTLTLGRQFLLARPAQLRQLARERGIRLPAPSSSSYAEALLRDLLGAARVEALDATAYEGASIVHDMNAPLPKRYACSFDAVIDGGSLEHIFNLPVAIANCMRATAVGGRFFSFTVANNFLGHGFYQFSPELFFRALAPAHGFAIERVLLIEYSHPSIERARVCRRYEVRDPAAVGSRVTLVNGRPLLIQVQARKLAHFAEPFAVAPQQSDYVAAWRSTGRRGAGLARTLARLPLVGRALTALYNRYQLGAVHTLSNRRFFAPISSRPAAARRRPTRS